MFNNGSDVQTYLYYSYDPRSHVNGSRDTWWVYQTGTLGENIEGDFRAADQIWCSSLGLSE